MVGQANGVFDHSQIISIDKTSLFDFNPGGAFIPATGAGIVAFTTNLDNLSYGLVPARMHDAPPGAPEYFVATQGIGGNGTPFSNTSVRILRMTRELSATPLIDISSYSVANYGNGPLPAVAQPDSALNAADTRFTSLAWRGNMLVATQTAKVRGHDAEVRWYQWDTTTRKPLLSQSGTIEVPNFKSTYFASVDISVKGDIAIVYNESGPNEFMSIYLTGRSPTDPRGFLQAPVVLYSGQATYKDAAGEPFLPGSVSSIAFDPASPNSFYATAMYASNTRTLNNWATFIGRLNLTPLVASPLKLLAPIRWVYDRPTNSFSGNAMFINTGATLSGTLLLQLTPSDPQAIIYSPPGFRINNKLFVAVSGVFITNTVMKIPLTLRTPNLASVGTVFTSLFTGIL
jgi:hypothetical protein